MLHSIALFWVRRCREPIVTPLCAPLAALRWLNVAGILLHFCRFGQITCAGEGAYVRVYKKEKGEKGRGGKGRVRVVCCLFVSEASQNLKHHI